MSNLNYLYDLYLKLSEHKTSVLKQRGKSDIETLSYPNDFDQWYVQINHMIEINPPTDYVKTMQIFQDQSNIIKKIKYIYCKNGEVGCSFSINMYWDEVI